MMPNELERGTTAWLRALAERLDRMNSYLTDAYALLGRPDTPAVRRRAFKLLLCLAVTALRAASDLLPRCRQARWWRRRSTEMRGGESASAGGEGIAPAWRL